MAVDRPTRREVLAGAAAMGAAACVPATDGDVVDTGDSGADAFLDPTDDRDLVTVTKWPWVFVAAGALVLRFETLEDRDAPVRARVTGGAWTHASRTSPTGTELHYQRDTFDVDGTIPDLPGVHQLHEVRFEDLGAGDAVEWVVELGGGQIAHGRCTMPAGPGTAFRFGWIADTMYPQTAEQIAPLSTFDDLAFVLHGGDLQYESSPLDTWNGWSQTIRPLTSTALWHQTIGNHEFEDEYEPVEMFDRLFAGQGDAGGTPRTHAFSVGSARFVVLDSETKGFAEPDDPQMAWLDAELAASKADDDVKVIVVAFHRPLYTFSKHWQSGDSQRDALQPRLVAAEKVKLVLSGHVHGIEDFLVEGIHFVCDGGGGALLYDVDEHVDDIDDTHPGLTDKRVFAQSSYGFCIVDVAADGALTLRRYATDGFDDGPVHEIAIA